MRRPYVRDRERSPDSEACGDDDDDGDQESPHFRPSDGGDRRARPAERGEGQPPPRFAATAAGGSRRRPSSEREPQHGDLHVVVEGLRFPNADGTRVASGYRVVGDLKVEVKNNTFGGG